MRLKYYNPARDMTDGLMVVDMETHQPIPESQLTRSLAEIEKLRAQDPQSFEVFRNNLANKGLRIVDGDFSTTLPVKDSSGSLVDAFKSGINLIKEAIPLVPMTLESLNQIRNSAKPSLTLPPVQNNSTDLQAIQAQLDKAAENQRQIAQQAEIDRQRRALEDQQRRVDEENRRKQEQSQAQAKNSSMIKTGLIVGGSALAVLVIVKVLK